MPGVSTHKRGIASIESSLRKELKQIILDHAIKYNKEIGVVWGWVYRAVENRHTELGDIRVKSRQRMCSQLDIIEEAGYLGKALIVAEEILGKKKQQDLFS